MATKAKTKATADKTATKDNEKDTEAVEKVERRGRPKGTTGTVRNDLRVHTNPGDNRKYIRHCLWGYNLPPIDIADPKQVQQRIVEYFQKCVEDDMKPTVTGCSMAIGIDRRTFNSWANGVCRGDSHQPLIKKAHDFIEEMMESYMVNGKINPVSGIFLMKNNHGYTDQQDVVIAPKNALGEETPAAELQQKYLEGADSDDSDED